MMIGRGSTLRRLAKSRSFPTRNVSERLRIGNLADANGSPNLKGPTMRVSRQTRPRPDMPAGEEWNMP